MSDVGSESIYENPYTYHRYDDYEKSRPTEIILNISNDQSIGVSDDRGESVYEDPYSTNIYNIYENNRPGNIILKYIAEKKKWFRVLVALSIIGTLVVGLLIYLREIQKNLIWSSTSAPTTSLTLGATTPISLTSTAQIWLPPTTPITLQSTTPILSTSTTALSFPSTTIMTTNSPVKAAVLVLSTNRPANLPLVMELNGKADFAGCY